MEEHITNEKLLVSGKRY